MPEIMLRGVFETELITHAFAKDVSGSRLLKSKCGKEFTSDKFSAWGSDITCKACLIVIENFDPVVVQAAMLAADPLRRKKKAELCDD